MASRLLREQLANLVRCNGAIGWPEADMSEAHPPSPVDNQAGRHARDFELLREAALRIEAHLESRFELFEQPLGIAAIVIDVDGDDGQALGPWISIFRAATRIDCLCQ